MAPMASMELTDVMLPVTCMTLTALMALMTLMILIVPTG